MDHAHGYLGGYSWCCGNASATAASIRVLQNVAFCATMNLWIYLDRVVLGVYNRYGYGKEEKTHHQKNTTSPAT